MNAIVRKLCAGLGGMTLAVACVCVAVASSPGSQPADATAGPKEKDRTSKPAEPAKPLTEAALEKLLKKLEEELGDIQTLWTEFKQEKHLSVFSDVVKAEGTCLFRRPDTVRFELTKPFHSVMIAKGKTVEKFELVDRQWRKLKLGNPDAVRMVTGQIASWLQGKFRDQNDIYEISAMASQHTTLILTPREKRLREYISSIELTLTDDQKRIASVTIRESEGDFTVMRFTQEQRDVPLPERVFDTAGAEPTPLPPRKKVPATPPATGRSEAPTSRPNTAAPSKRGEQGRRLPKPADTSRESAQRVGKREGFQNEDLCDTDRRAE